MTWKETEEIIDDTEQQHDDRNDNFLPDSGSITPFSADSQSTNSFDHNFDFDEEWNEQHIQQVKSNWEEIQEKIIEIVKQHWDQQIFTIQSLYTETTLTDTFLSILQCFDSHSDIISLPNSVLDRYIFIDSISSLLIHSMLNSPSLINELFPIVVEQLLNAPQFFGQQINQVDNSKQQIDKLDEKVTNLLDQCCLVSSSVLSSNSTSTATSFSSSSVTTFLFRFIQSNLQWFRTSLIHCLERIIQMVQTNQMLIHQQFKLLIQLCNIGKFYLLEHPKGKGTTYYDVTDSLIDKSLFDMICNVLLLPSCICHSHIYCSLSSSSHQHYFTSNCLSYEQCRIDNAEIECNVNVEADGIVTIQLHLVKNPLQQTLQHNELSSSSIPSAPLSALSSFVSVVLSCSRSSSISALSSCLFPFFNSCCFFTQYPVDAIVTPIWIGLLTKGIMNCIATYDP